MLPGEGRVDAMQFLRGRPAAARCRHVIDYQEAATGLQRGRDLVDETVGIDRRPAFVDVEQVVIGHDDNGRVQGALAQVEIIRLAIVSHHAHHLPPVETFVDAFGGKLQVGRVVVHQHLAAGGHHPTDQLAVVAATGKDIRHPAAGSDVQQGKDLGRVIAIVAGDVRRQPVPGGEGLLDEVYLLIGRRAGRRHQ